MSILVRVRGARFPASKGEAMWQRRSVRVVALAVVCLVLPACSGSRKINDEDFRKAKNNMTEAEVLEALGKPSESSETDSPLGKMKIMVWQGEGDKGYMVSFQIGKSMMTMSSDMKNLKNMSKG